MSERDTILTIAIGDVTKHGDKLSADEWQRFKAGAHLLATLYGTVVFRGDGAGVTSDQPTETDEQSHALIVVVDETHDLDVMRWALADLLRRFGQSSACFAIDSAHEPTFDTHDGNRPAQPVKAPILDRPAHKGYPGS